MAKTTIHSDYIPDNAITGVKIAENSITAREIATNAITSLYVADDSVTADKLANSINTDIALGVAALPKAGGSLTGALDITAGGNQLTLSRSGFDNILFGTGTVNGQVGFHITNSTDSVVPFSMHENAPAATLVVDSSGNVGIGTSSPAEALTVNGNIGISDGKIYNGAASNSAGVSLPNSTVRIDGYNGITFHSSSTTVGSQTERMSIDSSGIIEMSGTKTYGSNTGLLRLRPSFTGTNYSSGGKFNIVFGHESVANSHIGEVRVTQTDPSASTASTMEFFTNSGGGNTATAERMRIDSSGNVGIGTNNPLAELNVDGRIVIDDGARANPTGGPSVVIDYQTTSDVQGRIRSRDWDGATWKNFTIEADDIILSPAGNVGIGTTSPAAPLDVKFVDNTNAQRWSYGSSEDNFYLELDTAIPAGGVVTYNFNTKNNGTLYNNNLVLDRGKVGIGSTDPSSRLELGTLPDDDWITLEQSGRKNAIGGYFSSTSTGTLWKLKMTTGSTNGSMNEIYRLSSAGTLTFMQNSAKVPLIFHGTGTGTYDKTAIYTGQNNTSGNYMNGMLIEMGRLTNSSTAEVRGFVVAARGGQSSFKVLENSSGVTQADGDYLARLYQSGSDGYLALYTGQATPLEQTRISSYGQTFFHKDQSGLTSTNRTIVSIGTDEQSAAGTFHVSDGGSTNNGGMRQTTHSSRVYTNVSSIYTQVSANRYWHIKTNIQSPNNVMYIARVHGYAYGNAGHIIDLQRSGYAYSSHGLHTNTQSANNGSSTSHTLDIYFASDNYLCFRCDSGGGYFTGLSLDIKFQSPTGYNWNYKTIEHQINSNSGSYY